MSLQTKVNFNKLLQVAFRPSRENVPIAPSRQERGNGALLSVTNIPTHMTPIITSQTGYRKLPALGTAGTRLRQSPMARPRWWKGASTSCGRALTFPGQESQSWNELRELLLSPTQRYGTGLNKASGHYWHLIIEAIIHRRPSPFRYEEQHENISGRPKHRDRWKRDRHWRLWRLPTQKLCLLA